MEGSDACGGARARFERAVHPPGWCAGIRGREGSLAALPPHARKAAVAIARAATRASPQVAALWQNLGLALVSMGGTAGHAASRVAYLRAVELDPLSAENHLGLASTQAQLEAVQTLRRAIERGEKMHGPRAALHYNLGNLLQHARYAAGRAAHAPRRSAAA